MGRTKKKERKNLGEYISTVGNIMNVEQFYTINVLKWLTHTHTKKRLIKKGFLGFQ